MQMNSELTAYCSNFAVGLTSSIFARFTGVEKGLVYSRRLRQSDPSVALNATETLLRKYQEHLKRAKSLGWKLSPVKGAQVYTYMFLLYAAYALAFWYGVRLFARHEVSTVGKVITTLFSIIIRTNAFSQLAGYLGSFMKIATAGVELFQIIEHREGDEHGQSVEVTHGEDGIHSLVSTVSKALPKGDIEFRDISFCYPLCPDVQVLKEFSLSIPSGKITALVGQSGSGKSTIASLLERWYEPGEGSISIGGQNVDQFRASELRESIGLVQQVKRYFVL
jgi:ATP-binding cassette, subfamily B (MDR/TAP), member 1